MYTNEGGVQQKFGGGESLVPAPTWWRGGVVAWWRGGVVA